MSTAIDGELTTLAFCWRIERRDGAGLALTSHDRALVVDGTRYDPAPGITPSAIRLTSGLEAGSGEVGGVLSDRSISEVDLNAGRWDGAALRLFAVNWEAPDSGEIELLAGELGQVASKDGSFSADLLGAAAKLERPVCPTTSPECRAELGDARCRVDMAGRRMRAKVVEIDGDVLRIDRSVGDGLRFGQIWFLAGAANGERRTILDARDGELVLRGAPCGVVSAGTPVELVEGCDKGLESCAGRFANAVNFRGEPHLPGNDLLTRYPGA